MAKFSIRILCAALLLVCVSTRLEAAAVTVAWDANSETNIGGYAIRYGLQRGVYTQRVDVGNVTRFTLMLPSGTYYFVVEAYNTLGDTSLPSAEVSATVVAFPATAAPDLDGDLMSDLTLWRPTTGTWYWLTSSTTLSYNSAGNKQWGTSGDVPLSGDLDGDGGSDLVIWRGGTWYWLTSSTGYSYASAGSRQWGNPALGDVPMLGDVDGDRKADLIIWRASTGTWYWLTSSTGYDHASAGSKQWGNQSLGDIPMRADMDGDGKADLMLWRASTGTWFWLTSSSGYSYAASGAKQWGNAGLGDVPLTGDLDGDGLADLAVWRASTGTWFWLKSASGYNYATAGAQQWGAQSQGDVPFLTDLDGDYRADLTVWRASSGTWYWLTSTSGYAPGSAGMKQWGAPNVDIPVVK
jgi:hypothetical protein